MGRWCDELDTARGPGPNRSAAAASSYRDKGNVKCVTNGQKSHSPDHYPRRTEARQAAWPGLMRAIEILAESGGLGSSLTSEALVTK